ncbi:hypothetical protein KA119_01155 [Candidatus Gracilibacteria bacterium]|nr:hypothetical protein [Candidatus Gracilibacteria bacterium]
MATSKTLFVSETCIHCQRLEAELQKSGTKIETIDITQSPQNLAAYIDQATAVGYQNGGVPLLIDGQTYIEGTDPILQHLGLLTATETESTTLTKEDAVILKEIATPKESPSILIWLLPLAIIAVILILKLIKK